MPTVRLLLLACVASALLAADPAAAAPKASGALGDVLTLDNDQSIACSILPHPQDDGFLVISTGSGVMWIRKERVKKVTLGLEGQMKALDSTDPATLIALARWCLVRGHDQQALTALERARGLPGVTLDLETLGLYATLLDQAPARGPKAALPIYRTYKADGGSDEKILGRLQELEDAIAAHNDQLKKLNLPPGFLPQSDSTPAEAPIASDGKLATVAKDGIEGKGWDAENEKYSNPVAAKVQQLPPEQGGVRALAVTSPGGGKDKAAIKKSVTYAVDDDHSVLSLNILNRGDKPMKIAIAMKTNGQKWLYHESALKIVPPSDTFKEVRFNLRGNDYKSQATNWANNGTIVDLNDIKELQLLIYNGKEEANVLVHGMNFIKDSEL
ncbi:MAG: hypothetical protein H0V44_01765 [Planctomycetes bacterium]|nr:hypothetical protein [Planctomycetota bacterium]